MQSFNLPGILHIPYVLIFKRNYLKPDKRVRSINDLQPRRLAKNFKAVLFDKDNTLTAVYKDSIHKSIEKKLLEFKKYFKNIAIVSNSSGSSDDKKFKGAEELEKKLGIDVLRHGKKKPDTIEVSHLFDCRKEEVLFIGDRIWTDIVFGNKNGFYTIKVEPFHDKDRHIRFLRWLENRM